MKALLHLASARALVLATVLATLTGCGEAASSGQTRPPAPTAAADAPQAPRLKPVAPYRPPETEVFPNAKQVAGRLAQRVTTYDPDDSASDAPTASTSGRGTPRSAQALKRPGWQSRGRVVYPQMCGVTATRACVMVVTEQLSASPTGERSRVTRTLDVRLRLDAGRWKFAALESIGGRSVARPPRLGKSAKAVIDHPRIVMSDSARWDIYRGEIDPRLLDSLATAARDYELGISTFSDGHPKNVYGTDRLSAHSAGSAVDIYAVDGVPVVDQRDIGTPAYELAQEFSAAGATQLGSPWIFQGTGASFTDAIHADHLHLQRAPLRRTAKAAP